MTETDEIVESREQGLLRSVEEGFWNQYIRDAGWLLSLQVPQYMVEQVLLGEWIWKRSKIKLVWWNAYAGSAPATDKPKSTWIRVLPMHLWTDETFHDICELYAMREFSDCIEDMELIDLQLIGGSYTLFKEDNHTTASRIDRILWEQSKSYFKFENWWMSDRVMEWWSDFELHGNLKVKKNNILNQMAEIESHLNNRTLIKEETARKATLFIEYKGGLELEIKGPLAQGGDRNTEFFYQIANAHKRERLFLSQKESRKRSYVSTRICIQKLKIGDPLKTSAIIQPSQKLERRLCKKILRNNKTKHRTLMVLQWEQDIMEAFHNFHSTDLQISKVLTARLKRLVDKQHIAFVRGRRIMDAVPHSQCFGRRKATRACFATRRAARRSPF
ncbi:hypothetical protein H5410_061854 [Solanum commersonii]|uniref:Uncharacterized protein n=1 Tax=Solanum commersonii TaxID=4109 RepID=A0A9J5WAG2_SOLCO|nr:hypothetical protein H5410_061854 [Solanum commersonii]